MVSYTCGDVLLGGLPLGGIGAGGVDESTHTYPSIYLSMG